MMRLPAGLRLQPGCRQDNAEGGSGRAARDEREGTAVRFGDPPCDRQSQAAAGSAAGPVELDKSIEDSLAILSGDAGALISHVDRNGRAVGQTNRDGTSGARVLDRVLAEVHEQSLQEMLVASKGDLGRR